MAITELNNEEKIENIELAFMHLSFSIRLSEYIRSEHINIKLFNDSDIVLKEPNSIVTFSSEDFDYNKILAHGEINILITFGTAAMVLWQANERKISQINTEEENILGLLYSIRNCFAHSPAAPSWHLKNPIYQRTFIINEKEIDLSNKNKQIFNFDDIQGLETLYYIKDFLIKKLEQNNDQLE